jgi:hypothetical protein
LRYIIPRCVRRTPQWIGPCNVLDIFGRSAAHIELPTALCKFRMHDVFHFSVLKPYHEPTHPNQQEIMVAPGAREDPSDPSRREFEVSHIANHDTIPHAHTQIPSLHFLVHWLGYDSNEATWLPVDALSSCLHKVADYLFTIATARTQLQVIAQFPCSSRDTLLNLLHPAKNTLPLPRPPCRPRVPNSIPCAK